MKVLILGGSGYIGQHLVSELAATDWAIPVMGSRHAGKPRADAISSVAVDSVDEASLKRALEGCDAVVNCVAGDAQSISKGAESLVTAALAVGCKRIVHLSSMAVYGPVEGRVAENAPLDPSLGWYGKAKCEAERSIASFAAKGGEAILLRPGCVYGPESQLWVGRIGEWLQSRRLGDLGPGGDGWSNLVHIRDVVRALCTSLRLDSGPSKMQTFNLSAPDSPRWNEYFIDLALLIGATPVKRLSALQLRLDSRVAGPPLKIIEIALKRAAVRNPFPLPLSPGLPRLWAQQIHLDAAQATRELFSDWTPYHIGLAESAAWIMSETGASNSTTANLSQNPRLKK